MGRKNRGEQVVVAQLHDWPPRESTTAMTPRWARSGRTERRPGRLQKQRTMNDREIWPPCRSGTLLGDHHGSVSRDALAFDDPAGRIELDADIDSRQGSEAKVALGVPGGVVA